MMSHPLTTLTLLTLGLASMLGSAAESSFYKEPQLFSTAPSEKVSEGLIARFGPVGIGVELHQPAFVMKIKNVEEGSPAAATGMLRKGQIIESINGGKLADIDPRIQLGNIITAAEAGDGGIRFMIKETPEAPAQEVVVKIPVLGTYSKTWPLNCPKSDRIVRDFADYLKKPGAEKGFSDIGMLFLLSTGEDKDLEPVKQWVHSMIGKDGPPYAWTLGFGGIPLCEYYLRTGDPAALPVIQAWVTAAAKGEYLDGWAGRGGVVALNYGNGHLNAGGTAVVTFLLLAKECGAEVDDSLLHRTLVHFFRFAGRGLNPYGDDRPENSFVDNGKNGNLAFAMAAAASLTPEGEKSIYARARDTMAMTSFYTTTFMLHGHTGGGIGEIWRSTAMGLLMEKRPNQYREFMDNRKWHYELSRRFDGSFGILDGADYDTISWGAAYALTYTIPRRTLRLTGATSKFAKSYALPERPWGTAADDEFQSLDEVADKDGKRQDLSNEILARDSGKPLLERLTAMGDVSDDLLRSYVHHQDYLIRRLAANHAMGLKFSYMFRQPGARIRPALVEEFARSSDPRIRNAGLRAVAEQFDPNAEWAPRLYAIAIERLSDPEESWWIKDAALSIAARGTPDMIVPHVDLLIPFLKHQEQWLQNGALSALAKLVADARCYQKVLPAVGDLLQTCQRYSTTGGPTQTIRANLLSAGPEVKKTATEALGKAYGEYAGVKTWAGGQDVSTVYDAHLEILAETLCTVPGGYDALYEIAKQRFPHEPLPYARIFLNADPEKFGPELKKAIKPIILERLVPEFVGKNRVRLQTLAEGGVQTERPGGISDAVDQLVGLYARAGQADYDWHMFHDLRNARWSYFSFDPIPAEQVLWDKLTSRYREVTMPAGMENWYAADFDPSRAGWKTGKSPFGQYNGEIPKVPIMKCSEECAGPPCYAGTPINTLWENEVLLMRGTFKFPPLQDGNRYRLLVNDGMHPGSGGGHIIYINGKPLVESKTCVARDSGQSKGGFITTGFLQDFRSGDVTIAVKTFIRYNDRFLEPPTVRIPQGHISLHLEEMKLPPMGDDLTLKSATVVPMLSAEWQAKQSPNNKESQGENERFRYDGKFVANSKVVGAWAVAGMIPDIDQFDPATPLDADRAPLKAITLKDGGLTDSATMIWSGDTLMDLNLYQALKMTPKTIGGNDYLFVEAGGFSATPPPGWKTPLVVMKRQ